MTADVNTPHTAEASAAIHELRSDLKELIPDSVQTNDVATAYAMAVFANVAEHIASIERLIAQGSTTSAAVLLRAAVYAMLKLKWLVQAENTELRDARFVELQRQSNSYEQSTVEKAKQHGGDEQVADALLSVLQSQRAEIVEWLNKNPGDRPRFEEIQVAKDLGLADFITPLALLDSFTHINRPAVAGLVKETEAALVVGGTNVSILAVITTTSLRCMTVSVIAFLELVGAPESLVEDARDTGAKQLAEAIVLLAD